jgi:carbonic anhydrase/acetyltransferase-like protein (isoleucine patch superfamily)
MRLSNGVYIADTARVMGDVELGKNVNIWYSAVVRGDVAKIVVGQGTNIQDSALIHCDYGEDNTIGEYVTIGHHAVVHGQAVGDHCLIGMGAVLLARTKIGNRCIIAAGAVVSPGKVIPDESVVMGIPGIIVRSITDRERDTFRKSADGYVTNAKLHCESPADPRVVRWGE